ncbi:MAG: hypothetical protein HEQ40_11020 [Lacibacter sp.]|jgi:hypothetical protein
MKKLPVYLTIGLALLFIFSSCKRNDYEMKKETPVFSINQAKEWFANNLQATTKSRTTNTASRLIDSLPPNNKTLLWKFAIQKKNSEVEAVELPYTGTAVVCELPDSSYANNQQRNAIALGIAKRAVIYKKPNGAIELMLVHVVPSYDYLLTHPNHFKENYFLKLAADFTGWVYTYDWNDNPKSVSEIKNGKLNSGKTLFVKDSIAPQGTTNRWVTGYVQECGYAWVGVQNPYWCGQPGDPHYEDCINNSSTGGTGNWVYTCKWVLSQIWVPDPITGGGTGGQTGGSGTPPDDCNYYGTCDPNNYDCNAVTAAMDNPVQQSTSTHLYTSVEDDPNNPNKRTVRVKWEFWKLTSPLGNLYGNSWEKGEHEKVNGAWKWITFTHDTHSISQGAGIFLTGTITALSPLSTIQDPFGYAKMDLSYTIDVDYQCVIPLDRKTFYGNSGIIRHVDHF